MRLPDIDKKTAKVFANQYRRVVDALAMLLTLTYEEGFDECMRIPEEED